MSAETHASGCRRARRRSRASCEHCLDAARVVGRAVPGRARRRQRPRGSVAAEASVAVAHCSAGHEIVLRRVERPPRSPTRREAAPALMIERQHVWLGPEATTFEEPCEACLSYRDGSTAQTCRRARDAAARRRRRLHDVQPRPSHRRPSRRARPRAGALNRCQTPLASRPRLAPLSRYLTPLRSAARSGYRLRRLRGADPD